MPTRERWVQPTVLRQRRVDCETTPNAQLFENRESRRPLTAPSGGISAVAEQVCEQVVGSAVLAASSMRRTDLPFARFYRIHGQVAFKIRAEANQTHRQSTCGFRRIERLLDQFIPDCGQDTGPSPV